MCMLYRRDVERYFEQMIFLFHVDLLRRLSFHRLIALSQLDRAGRSDFRAKYESFTREFFKLINKQMTEQIVFIQYVI